MINAKLPWLLLVLTKLVAVVVNIEHASSFITRLHPHTTAWGAAKYHDMRIKRRTPTALTLSAAEHQQQPFARRPETPFIRTLLIDNYDSYTYNLAHYLATVNGISPVVVYNDAFGGDWDTMLSSVGSFDNIVISPGPGTPENPDDFGLCREALQQSDTPVLGRLGLICFSSYSCLAHALQVV